MGRGVRIGRDDGGSGSSGWSSGGRTFGSLGRPTEPVAPSGDVSQPPRQPRPRPAYRLVDEDDDDDDTMGRRVQRRSDDGGSGSSGRSSRGRSSGSMGRPTEPAAPIGEGSRPRRQPRPRQKFRGVDEDDDDDVPDSPLAAAMTSDDPPADAAKDTMDHLQQMMDECEEPPPLPRGGNRLTRSEPLTKHGDELFHRLTDRVLDPRMPRQMSLTIQGRVTGVWPSWKFVSAEVKNLMCNEWMELYDFRPEDLPRARNAFMSNAPDLYKQMMKRVRDKAKRLMEREDYMDDCQAGRPEWMAPEVWEGLCRDHWSTTSWQKVSSTNKSNRLKPKDADITRHTGGSVSIEIHEGRLAKELGRPPTFYDVFERTHRSNKGKGFYKDKKSEGVAERYLQQMQAQYGDDVATYPELDVEAYRIAVGAPNRGICYGLGSTTQSALRLPGSAGSSRESRSSQCTQRGPHSSQTRGVMTDPDVLRRLEMIEARFHDPVQPAIDPTQLHSMVRGAVQEEMESMRAGVVADVTTNVTSNVVSDLARTMSQLQDRFISELRASEERQNKQRQTEMAARDKSLIMAMMKNVRSPPGSGNDDETQPPGA